MKRYSNTKIRFDKSGLRVYGTTYYPKVSERDTDMYFVATDGDRCDSLAYRFYGSSTLWWFIAHINNIKSMNIPAGTKLRIPIQKPSGY